jgi:hypothetical protein
MRVGEGRPWQSLFSCHQVDLRLEAFQVCLRGLKTQLVGGLFQRTGEAGPYLDGGDVRTRLVAIMATALLLTLASFNCLAFLFGVLSAWYVVVINCITV